MSTIVAFGLTTEQFRANEAHRNTLKTFLETPTGAEILYILRQYGRPQKVAGFPEDKLVELRSVAHARSEGILDSVDHLLSLLQPLHEKQDRVTTRKLSDPTVPEDLLPPPFPKPVLKP